ncbi:hypothetical protein IGB42_01262 [Andreprevotia sp. IGB-42]|nr:hypothetical protein IGB42_01262 [Andreprevotia sp. IGB-42]
MQSAFEASRYFEVLNAFEQTEERSVDDAKLDLQLLWLARVLTPALPAPCTLTVGLEHVEWLATTQPAMQAGWLALCFSSTFPYLVSLQAQIESTLAVADGWRCTARWRIEDDALRTAFERTVFRRHREQIRRQHTQEH